MPRLRASIGSSTTSVGELEDISHLVNPSTPHRIQSDAFDGEVVVHILDFVGSVARSSTPSSPSSSPNYRSGGYGGGGGNVGSGWDRRFLLLDGEKGCHVEHSSSVRLFLHDKPPILGGFLFFIIGEQ